MVILSKGCKPDDFESHNSLKLSFTNSVDCGSFLKLNSPDILAICEPYLDESIDSDNFSVRGYFPFIQKDCATHMHVLTVYVKKDFLLHGTYLEKTADSYLCFRLALLQSV